MGSGSVPKAKRLPAGVAAGHPATTEAALAVLADGGSAADAAIAGCLASCVAETVMTGLLGGGHALLWDARAQRARNLDCFCSVPGLDAERPPSPMDRLAVPFGEELVHYAIGAASCAVPGLPAGLGALHAAHGRLPWPRLVEPALRLARDGVPMGRAHADCLAMLAPVMTLDAGAAIYAPGGRLLEEGDLLRQPGLARALELLADEGAASAYGGTIGRALLELVEERGGTVTRQDLDRYEARWTSPAELDYAGPHVFTRAGLSGVPATLRRLPPLAGLDGAGRLTTLVELFATHEHVAAPHTTNLVAVAPDGDVCVLTTSLGLGSGDYLPGLDLHLNSMLGEVDLQVGASDPGGRMESMMAPTLACDGHGPALAGGAAGGTRLRTALVCVVAGILDEGVDPTAAVERPRFHPTGRTLNAEPGVDEGGLLQLERQGWHVRRWPSQHHYFGGVSAIGRAGAAADPRRSGRAALLER